MRDSYIEFLRHLGLSKQDFFQFGLNEIIYAKEELADQSWSDLKRRIEANQKVYIRGFGRNASGTSLFQNLYADVLQNQHVVKDPTNNAEPTKLIKKLTGYSKTPSKQFETLRNYQISHVFGKTKNVYAFTAPWNIVYVPKIIDPFTGHEAKGSMVEEFTTLFQKAVHKRFNKQIDEFNEIMVNPLFLSSIAEHIEKLKISNGSCDGEVKQMEKAVIEEFSPIEL